MPHAVRRYTWPSAALCLVAVVASTTHAAGPDARGVAFFEKKIRPVLVEQCYSCHSAEAKTKKKLRGSLYVDSRTGLLEGGDTGPAVVPGKPDQGTLLPALRYAGDVHMPPRSKLPAAVVADFETWVRMGAPDPRGTVTVKAQGIDIGAGRKFWCYQPLHHPTVPIVKDGAWPRGDVDRFLLARLEARGLRPAAEADRATLVRRLYFDLVGFGPTPEQVDAFVRDPAPDAYERLVDRLLASPHFGERWGRHWLDLARYAESLTLRGFVLKEAWRYRDYVIDSFNADLPFDRFVRAQVAGDLLPAANLDERRRQLAATTFLTLGNTNLEEQDKPQLVMDVVDEQLDVIGRTFLAQTLGCARCHDHKFDPIPTRDYYALAGILRNSRTLEHANVSKWLEVPLPGNPAQEVAWQRHEAQVAALQERIQGEKRRLAKAGKAPSPRGRVVAAGDLPGVVVDDVQARKVGEWKASRFSGSYVGAGYVHDLDSDKGAKTLTFLPELPHPGTYEVRLAYSPGGNRAEAVPVTICSADGDKVVRVNQREAPPIDGLFVSLGRYRFEPSGRPQVRISNQGTRGHVVVDAVAFLPIGKTEAAKPARVARAKAGSTDATLRKLEAELKRLKAAAPQRDMVMTVQEEKTITDLRVHVRGSVHSLGEQVPRGFLQVATRGTPPSIPAGASGRRQLADWLADPNNPLTARVFVNRAWHWLFGAGLVRTTDNFGSTGEKPSHPELLDHLAADFVQDGWSVKRLVRRLVLSRAYRLSSTASPQARAADPDNRLLAHAHCRRLDAECIRDTILAVSGTLRLDAGGPTFPTTLGSDYGFRHTDTRRSVYAPVFRNSLPELFGAFDFADPSVPTGRRDVSTVAPQALYLLNHPFVLGQARHAAARLLAEPGLDDAGRITRAYRLALGRPPSAGERALAESFLAAGRPTESWPLLFQALFASVDFRYLH